MSEIDWIEVNTDFIKINNPEKSHKIKWEGCPYKDLLSLSLNYFDSAFEISYNILSDERPNNIKTDTWFLPAVYLFRHGIELLLKAGIIKDKTFKPEIQKCLIDSKHDLQSLYKSMYKYFNNLSKKEATWLEHYLDNIEKLDKSSDLFRYPFNDGFLAKYENKFLDIFEILNKLLKSYNIIYKLIFDEYYHDQYLSEEDTNFLSLASHGIGNCYLWESPWSDKSHKQIIGYSEAAEFLYNKIISGNKTDYIYPFLFLYRNAIELTLKRLLFTNTEISVDHKIAQNKRNSHLLLKDLWRHIKPILSYYGEKTNQDLNLIEIAETYITQINSIDKNGDRFRYPFTYSLEYKFDNKIIDIENVNKFMKSIFNFLDGCNDMLYEISQHENSHYY